MKISQGKSIICNHYEIFKKPLAKKRKMNYSKDTPHFNREEPLERIVWVKS
jgi:hypothetical protein